MWLGDWGYVIGVMRLGIWYVWLCDARMWYVGLCECDYVMLGNVNEVMCVA